MLDAEREMIGTLGCNPWLFVGGGVAAVAWLVAQVVVAVPVMVVTLPTEMDRHRSVEETTYGDYGNRTSSDRIPSDPGGLSSGAGTS